MNTIESAQNPTLKHLAKLLRSARARRESGQAVLEGVHLLSAYLQAGGQVLQVYVPASKMQQPETPNGWYRRRVRPCRKSPASPMPKKSPR